MSESRPTNDPLDEAFADYLRMSDAGEIASREDFLKLFPDLADDLKELIEAADLLGKAKLLGMIEYDIRNSIIGGASYAFQRAPLNDDRCNE